jgi:hypothetical protein
MYKLIKNMFGVVDTVKNIETHACIPFSEDNSDYQTYLKWLAEGNTPEPADSE